jgi:hypothetical protein
MPLARAADMGIAGRIGHHLDIQGAQKRPHP